MDTGEETFTMPNFQFTPFLVLIDNPTTPEQRAPINPPRITTNRSNQILDNMYIERERLHTFYTWLKPFICKGKLAMYGFYHCGPDDNVKCAFCKVEISSWTVGDNVLREHLRWSPNCSLLKRRPTPNQPIDLETFERSLPPITADTVGNYFPIEHRENSYSETMYYKAYRKINDRLKSFNEWPKSMRQKPAELADAGFYYLQKGDQVKCFSCGGGLRAWQETDDPWEQHALWYSECQYLSENKSAEYIKIVKDKCSKKTIADENVHADDNNSIKEVSNVDDSKLCKICCDEEFNVVFYPCMHISILISKYQEKISR